MTKRFLTVHPFVFHRVDDEGRDPRGGFARAEEENAFVGKRAALDAQGRIKARERHRGRA